MDGGDDGGGDALLCSPLQGGGIHALGGWRLLSFLYAEHPLVPGWNQGMKYIPSSVTFCGGGQRGPPAPAD